MSEQTMTDDPRIAAVPDIHGHAKGEHKLFVDERPIPYTARMLFLWFFHACRRGAPRFLMVADHVNYLTFEDPSAVNLVRRALKLAQAGDLYGAAETAGVDVQHAAVVGEGLRRGMRYSIGAEVDNDPRSRPDAQNIVDAMRPDGIVRSIHFLAIKHPQFGENWMWPFDNPEFRDVYEIVGTEQTWELYMAALLDAIEKLPGHVLGHFYVPAKFGHWPSDDVLEAYEDRMLDACAERGMAVEINSRYYYKHAIDDETQLEKYSAANLRLLRKAKEKGVAVAVGSDAHSPKDQGRGFSDVLAMLDRAEINEIAFPIDGRLARVALRATEELRQASNKAAREERPLAVPIPGTEEPEPAEDEESEGTQAAEAVSAASERIAASEKIASSGSAPRKRPSRAKKPPVAPAVASEAVHSEEPPVLASVAHEATMSEAVETPEPSTAPNPAEAVVEAIATVAKRVTKKIADTLHLHAADKAPAEPEPESATEPAALQAATEPAASQATTTTVESEAVPEETAPDAPADRPTHEEDAHAVSADVSVKSVRPRAKASRPATAASTAKRPVKPAAKVLQRGKTAAKKTAAAKAAPAAKKRTAKKAASSGVKKVARPSRAAASVVKKTAAKKGVSVRKATKAAPVKTASRSTAKKATSKKTAAKKKATKSRR